MDSTDLAWSALAPAAEGEAAAAAGVCGRSAAFGLPSPGLRHALCSALLNEILSLCANSRAPIHMLQQRFDAGALYLLANRLVLNSC